MLLSDRYEIDELRENMLGRGGMAGIYPGVDLETGLPIAAKTLLGEFQVDPARRDRFRYEARVLEAVQHPHIVRLVDVIDSRQGSWIIMERLEGETLLSRIQHEGEIDSRQFGRWLQQLADALDHIHQLGYVHLDITPQNIFLNDHGDVTLIDFGIAQHALIAPRRDADKLLGTAAYVSPEHGAVRIVTPQSDVYSLGCVAYEALTGKRVFSEHGNLSNDALVTIRQTQMPRPASLMAPQLHVPEWVDEVIGKALKPASDQRYASAGEFADAFTRYSEPPWLRLRRRRRGSLVEIDGSPASSSGARRSTGFTKRLIRLGVVLSMLLVIAGSLFMASGPLIGWTLGAAPVSTTQIVNGNWLLRTGPGRDNASILSLQENWNVRITGNPALASDGYWWPVSTRYGNNERGWVHGGGLKETWLMKRIIQSAELRGDVSRWWNRMMSLVE